MITVRPDRKILIATQPVDFREGIHGLVALVAEVLDGYPYCGNIFIFRSERADRLKLIAWDGTGNGFDNKMAGGWPLCFSNNRARCDGSDSHGIIRVAGWARLDEGWKKGCENTVESWVNISFQLAVDVAFM